MSATEKATFFCSITAVSSVIAVAIQLGSSQSLPNNRTFKLAQAPEQPILRQIEEMCRRGEPGEARKLIDRLPDGETREQVARITTFFEARAALSRRDFSGAEQIARGVPPSFKRSLLLIAIASGYARYGATDSAARSLTDAIRFSEDVTPEQRVRLLTMAAAVYLRFDAIRGTRVLRQGIREYRTLSKAGAGGRARSASSSINSTRDGFYEVVRAGSGDVLGFPLSLPLLPGAPLSELALARLPLE